MSTRWLHHGSQARPAIAASERDPELLTISQAASLFKIQPSTVRRWVAQGLPTICRGRRAARISRATLLTMLTSGLPSSAAPPVLPLSWGLIRGGRDSGSLHRAPLPPPLA